MDKIEQVESVVEKPTNPEESINPADVILDQTVETKLVSETQTESVTDKTVIDEPVKVESETEELEPYEIAMREYVRKAFQTMTEYSTKEV